MKINILIIGLISLLITSFQVKTETQEYGDYSYLKDRLQNTKAFTIEVIEAMPESDYSYKPTNDVRTFTALASHVVYSIEWNIALMKKRPINWELGDENGFTKQELVEYVNSEFNSLIKFVAASNASPELTEKIIDVLNHNAHHRGQMMTYLRLKGITPPEYR